MLLVIHTVLAALGQYASNKFPTFLAIAHPIDAFGSILIVTLLFAMIFKYLPDVRIAWGDVWFGAIVTALLFTLGKHAIGYYLTFAAISSAYGAAGSIAVILLWAYYSSQILFFGAEITKARANFG
jgi:membrane protein